MSGLKWDVFCRVIDNYGDVGVCWRLASSLARRGHTVRLWLDDLRHLEWMAPHGCEGVEVEHWTPQQAMAPSVTAGDVVIEAFGCDIDPVWMAAQIGKLPHLQPGTPSVQRSRPSPVWINLEYLTAEPYARACHGLQSPILSGPAAGWVKYFFYPGFQPGSGGLLRTHTLAPSASNAQPRLWLGGAPRTLSLFCYEPRQLASLLMQLARGPERTNLRVLAGRGQHACAAATRLLSEVSPSWNQRGCLSIHAHPSVSQSRFDALMHQCDLNFVRGEDSLVSALCAGRPLVWQIYPQHDGAHASKLAAFLDWLEAPPSLRQFHWVWNGLSDAALPQIEWGAWARCMESARSRLFSQADLVTQLIDFAKEKRERQASEAAASSLTQIESS